MIQPGLVSITFRQLTPEEIIDLVSQAGLSGIEWGGDIHIPHGDIERAAEVRKMTQEAGLMVAAYGSYYRLGGKDSPKFENVLVSAVALETPKIRVWAGEKSSEAADVNYRQKVIDDAKRIADIAAEKGITIVTEWHGNTLMDKLDSALAFLAEVGRDNFKTYWQPLVDRPVETQLSESDKTIWRKRETTLKPFVVEICLHEIDKII